MPHLEVHLIAILVIGFVPHLHELVPDPIWSRTAGRGRIFGMWFGQSYTCTSKFTTFISSLFISKDERLLTYGPFLTGRWLQS